jgi:hypothetical protein
MKRHSKVLLLVSALVVGCSARYIAEYDPAIEGSARHLQASLDALFEDLSRTAGTPEGAYDRYADQYASIRFDLAALQHDASGQPRNEITSTSLSLLEDNLNLLEAAHREGLGRSEVPVLRKLFDAQLGTILELETAKKREHASGGAS